MRNVTLFIIVCLIASGCATNLSNFEKSELSGVEKGIFTVDIVDALNIQKVDQRNAQISNFIRDKSDLRNIIDEECTKKTPEVPAVAIPFIIQGARLLFDMYMDARIKATEELKEAAQAPYSVTKILTSDNDSDFTETNKCALLVRYLKNEENPEKSVPGLIALINLKKAPEDSFAMIMTPLYIKVNNSVAITKKGNDTKPAEINLSIAIATKAIGERQQLNGLPELSQVGVGVVSVPNIKIGSDASAWTCSTKEKNCPSSDLIAYPTKNNEVSLSFGFNEIGKIGIDLDQSIAELKAIKSAIGPALEDSLKAATAKKEKNN